MTILDSASLHKYLLHFTDTLTPELAEQFVNLPSDPEFQERLDYLGKQANEGALSVEEKSEYDTFIEAMDVVALLRVKILTRAK
jgi:hypothetical protein